MVDDIEEADFCQCLAYLTGQFSAPLWSGRFGQINYCEIGVFHYKQVRIASRFECRYIQFSLEGGGGT